MSEEETGLYRFVESITNQIHYFSKEYCLSNAEAVGGLEIIKHNLIRETLDDE